MKSCFTSTGTGDLKNSQILWIRNAENDVKNFIKYANVQKNSWGLRVKIVLEPVRTAKRNMYIGTNDVKTFENGVNPNSKRKTLAKQPKAISEKRMMSNLTKSKSLRGKTLSKLLHYWHWDFIRNEISMSIMKL